MSVACLRWASMHKLLYLSWARQDLADIYDYIAEDNLFYAQDVIDKITHSIVRLPVFPLIGTKIDTYTRYIVEPRYRYTIVYRVVEDTLYIVSIFKYKESWQDS